MRNEKKKLPFFNLVKKVISNEKLRKSPSKDEETSNLINQNHKNERKLLSKTNSLPMKMSLSDTNIYFHNPAINESFENKRKTLKSRDLSNWWEWLMRATDESDWWEWLMRATDESNWWEQLMRATDESDWWERLMRATDESDWWERLMRATDESDWWERLIRATNDTFLWMWIY